MSQKMIEGLEKYITDAKLSKSAAAVIRQVVGEAGIEKLAESLSAAQNSINNPTQPQQGGILGGITGLGVGGGIGAVAGAGLNAVFGDEKTPLWKRLLRGGAAGGLGGGAVGAVGGAFLGNQYGHMVDQEDWKMLTRQQALNQLHNAARSGNFNFDQDMMPHVRNTVNAQITPPPATR